MKNIVLVGFMGAGKTFISNYLSSKCCMKRVSTDDLIENFEKRTIADIFRESGEEYFRKIESQIIKDISEQKNIIVDCGGGVVLRQKNIDCLKKRGILFYLSTTAEEIYQRVKDQKQRPLLNVENPKEKIRELLEQRNGFYEKADYTILTTGKTGAQVGEEIIEFMKKKQDVFNYK